VDVVVLGGGPAGTSAALALARTGRSVVVLECTRYESERIGETLPPEVRLPLTALGVWERFLADDPLPSPGVCFAWGSPLPRDHDFLLNPMGSGWHIDRRRFDATLAAAAEAQGAHILRAAQLRAWERLTSGSWQLHGLAEDRNFELLACVLIDATGRRGSPIRRLGGGRIVHDRLVGLIAFMKINQSVSGIDHRTLVEATEDGWWYTALLPGGRHVAALMTDADLLPRKSTRRLAYWRDQLQKAPLSLSRLSNEDLENDPRIVAANCSQLRSVSGNGWVTAGDAAAALDPLSSQGVYRALYSGLGAARAVVDHLRGLPGALAEYARDVEETFAADLRDRAEYYGRERRWPDATFWRRRHSSSGRDSLRRSRTQDERH
jgi:flavin-dependent dehydrogenase